MKFFFTLLAGIAIGAAVVWFYYQGGRSREALQAAGTQVENAAQSARAALEEKLAALHLSSSEITNELARTGRVIRQKTAAAAQAISDATADARVTGSIKARLVTDPSLSALSISVNTTGGVVTLSGTVSSPEDIGKAILLAMETDGVHAVISTLQVRR